MFKAVTLVMIVLSLAAVSTNADKAESQDSEYVIKAAFLFNFAKFVTWPEGSFKDDLSPISLFVLGRDPFQDALDSIKDKSIKGRKLIIRRIQKMEETERCHILFISPSEKATMPQLIRSLGPVLTVSETQRFCQQGGMINFIKSENRIQLEINPDAAQQKKLIINPSLLKLANIVKTEN
jgi:hypothetical protein